MEPQWYHVWIEGPEKTHSTNVVVAAHAIAWEPLCHPLCYFWKSLRFSIHKISITLLLFLCQGHGLPHSKCKITKFSCHTLMFEPFSAFCLCKLSDFQTIRHGEWYYWMNKHPSNGWFHGLLLLRKEIRHPINRLNFYFHDHIGIDLCRMKVYMSEQLADSAKIPPAASSAKTCHFIWKQMPFSISAFAAIFLMYPL